MSGLGDIYGQVVKEECVILDIGSRVTRAGYAGEALPRVCLETRLSVGSTRLSPEVMLGFGEEEDEAEGTQEQLWPLALERFLRQIFFRHLLTNPKERVVLVCEHFVQPRPFRSVLAGILFRKLGVPRVMFLPLPALAALPFLLLEADGPTTAASSSGSSKPEHTPEQKTSNVPADPALLQRHQHQSTPCLVVDIGWRETRVVPIMWGQSSRQYARMVPLGAHSVHQRLREIIHDHGKLSSMGDPLPAAVKQDMTWINDPILMEDIIARACPVLPRQVSPNATYTEPDYAREIGPLQAAPWECSINRKTKLWLSGMSRVHVCEVLFEGDEEERSIATTILSSLKRCPIDERLHLAHNMVFIGGLSEHRGMTSRIVDECSALVNDLPEFACLSGLAGVFRARPRSGYIAGPSSAMCLGWIGASVFAESVGCLNEDDGVVSLDQYQHGTQQLPDWSTITEDLPGRIGYLSPDKPRTSVRVYAHTPVITKLNPTTPPSSSASSRSLLGREKRKDGPKEEEETTTTTTTTAAAEEEEEAPVTPIKIRPARASSGKEEG